MPIFYEGESREFQPYRHPSEKEFEKVVKSLADQLFGTTSIYLDIKKKIKSDEIAGIPDGYLVDLFDAQAPRLYVVENEIASHDPFRHIGVQLLKFVIAFDDAKLEIRQRMMEAIQADPETRKRLETARAKSNYRNVDNLLDAAVHQPFRGLVIIDDASVEVHRVLAKIHAEIDVLEIRTFISEDGRFCYLYDTLYDTAEDEDAILEDEKPSGQNSHDRRTPVSRHPRLEHRLASDTVIVPAKEEGFQQVFLGEHRWRAIRISPAMKARIKYIAAYQVAPISAITHIAEVKEIRPYGDTGKYELIFNAPAKSIGPIPLKNIRYKPQGPIYARHDRLASAASLDDVVGPDTR